MSSHTASSKESSKPIREFTSEYQLKMDAMKLCEPHVLLAMLELCAEKMHPAVKYDNADKEFTKNFAGWNVDEVKGLIYGVLDSKLEEFFAKVNDGRKTFEMTFERLAKFYPIAQISKLRTDVKQKLKNYRY